VSFFELDTKIAKKHNQRVDVRAAIGVQQTLNSKATTSKSAPGQDTRLGERYCLGKREQEAIRDR